MAIHLRLDRRVWERYANEAVAHSKPLSTYLRERLEREDELIAELASIRRALENLVAGPAGLSHPAGADGSSANVLLEVLLLCRAMAQHQRTDTAQAEIRRLGLSVWQPDAATQRR